MYDGQEWCRQDLKAGDHQEDLSSDERIIKIWVFKEIGWVCVCVCVCMRRLDWIDLAQDRDKCEAVVNMVMNLWVP